MTTTDSYTILETSGALWRLEGVLDDNDRLSAVWVRALHWPGCDDRAGHAEETFGVCRPDQDMRIAGRARWEAIGLDYTPVLDAVARVMATGDVADAALPPPDGTGKDEVY